ncbi:DUF1804 family protein [Neisseria bacilliformis]|uniref:DUF1804 family protein n=1 Tax=Neisseria bacilliformis TaxID=267212 RepID=UPI000666B490|nr:DUF1804 family protein [Neisseria bacilliformis]
MAHPNETRDKLRGLYVNSTSLEAAAAICGVSYGTARKWRETAKDKGDDWDRLRAAYTLSDGSIEDLARAIMTGFLVQYQNTMTMLQDAPAEELPPDKRVLLLGSLADAYTKTVAANKRVLPETSELATALKVLEMLYAFVREKHPKHLAAFAEIIEPFGAVLEKEFK